MYTMMCFTEAVNLNRENLFLSEPTASGQISARILTIIILKIPN